MRDALRGIGRCARARASRTRISFSHSRARLVERLEDLADLELLDAALEQRLERAQRVLVLRRRADHLAVRRDRLIEVVQPRLVDLTEAVLELEDLVRALADLGLAREDLGEIRPALGLREQAIERADRALVLRLGLEHPAVARRPPRRRSRAGPRRPARRAGRARRSAPDPSTSLSSSRVVELRDGRPALDRTIASRSSAPSDSSFWLSTRDGARVGVERVRVIVEALLVEPRDAVQELDLLERVVARSATCTSSTLMSFGHSPIAS